MTGGQTSLHLHTQNGQAKAFLEIQLGVPAGSRPGATDVQVEEPEPTHGPQHHVRPQQRQPRRRGPAARARDTARRAAWLLQRQKNQEAPAVEPCDVSEIASNLETRDIENAEVEAHSVKNIFMPVNFVRILPKLCTKLCKRPLLRSSLS